MDCLTYRRLKLATPQNAAPELLAHRQECGACAAFTRQLESFEQELHRVASIPIPDGLAEQIILRQRKPRWHSKLSMLAIAATLVLSVSAFVGYRMLAERNDLAGDFIAHVASEPDMLSMHGSVERVRFDEALDGYGARFEGPIGEIRFLGDCVVNGKLAKHILVQTQYGPATLLLFPQQRVSMSKPMSRDGFAVVILPLANGSMGIVTDTPDHALRVETLVKNRLRVRS